MPCFHPMFRAVFFVVALGLASPALACDYGYSDKGALAQDWPEADRDTWYTLSQGSRLVPKSWYDALVLPGTNTRFADPKHQETYGVRVCEDTGLPLGFVVDDDPIKGESLGLTCAACHTGELFDGTNRFIVEGGASDLDLQSYMADLFDGIEALYLDANGPQGPLWQGFASEVLAGNITAQSATQLRADLAAWLNNRVQVQASIEAGGNWSHGRTDAVQVILNTAAVLSGTTPDASLPPSTAPVSFPHVWNAPQMERVQWNGSAIKIKDVGLIKSMELGAITRNVAEVIGVFADISLTTDNLARTNTYPSIKSSIRMANLVRLERSMETLKSPKWPAQWGEVSKTSAAYLRGEALYDRECSSCHSVLNRNDLRSRIPDIAPGAKATVPATRLIPVFDLNNPEAPGLQTDPAMACHAMTHTSWTGKFPLLHNSFGAFRDLTNNFTLGALKPKLFPKDTATLHLIEELAIRLIYEKKDELVELQGQDLEDRAKQFFNSLIVGTGVTRGQAPIPSDFKSLGATDVPVEGTHALLSAKAIRERCAELILGAGPLTGTVTRPVYKARPLNGIFATAPYLHNGTVPTLFDLLSPPAQRPTEFYVGQVFYDRDKLGLGAPRPGLSNGLLRITDENGALLPGNSNEGHDYGTTLSAPDKAALLEYLKSL